MNKSTVFHLVVILFGKKLQGPITLQKWEKMTLLPTHGQTNQWTDECTDRPTDGLT